MRKFLIGIVFIIPIIIVLAITATGRIIALNHPLNAGRMELRDSNNEPIIANVNDIFVIDASDDTMFIVIDLYPSITDQNIVYTINKDISNACPIDLIRVEDTNHYRFVPHFDQYGMAISGVAEITIFAANNVSVSRTITVIVKSEVIREMCIYDADGKVIQDNLELFSPMQLFCDVNPIEALVYDDFRWSSSDPSIVRVSPNGMLNPISKGRATVSVTASDKKGNIHNSSLIVDTQNAVLRASSFKTSEVPSVSWIRANLLLEPSAEVSDLGDGSFAVSAGGSTYQISVEACETEELSFPQSLSTLYTQNGPYFAELEYADIARKNQSPAATFEVSDPTVIRIDAQRNMLIPLKAGTAELIAHFEGKTVKTTVAVKERPYAFNLLYTSADAKLGIQQNRVWGLNWLAPDRSYISTLQFGCSLAEDIADVSWQSSAPELASIDDNALITFYPEAAGQKITVRATVLVNNYATNIYREFTFNMVENPESVNVYNYDEFRYISDNTANDIVMQNTIIAGDYCTYVRGSVYGNGFLYDARALGYLGNAGILRLESQRVEDTQRKFVFNDLWVEADENFDDCTERGSAIVVDSVVNPVEFKYCILQYCATGIRLQSVKNVLVEGCILGYCANSSIEYTKDVSADYYFTVKNTVARQSGGPAIVIAPNKFDKEYFDRNTMPNFKVEGFFDVTNWKTPDDLAGLFSAFGPDSLSGIADFVEPQQLIDSLSEVLEGLFTGDNMRHLLYTNPADGNQYVCLGVFALGIYVKPNKDFFDLPDSSMAILPVVFPRDSSPIGIISVGLEIIVQTNLNMTIYNPSYLLSYDFSKGRKPKYGPGDSIPQNFELYNRLVHGNESETAQKQQIRGEE